MTSSSASSDMQVSNTYSESLLNNLSDNLSNNLPENLSGNNVSNDKNFKLELDKEGHLIDHSLWTPKVAQHLADTLSVTLTEEHYLILQQVRKFHVEFNHPPSTRPLIKYLMQTLPEMQISNQLLQQMFNTGLVARHVNRIAGLPKPPNCL